MWNYKAKQADKQWQQANCEISQWLQRQQEGLQGNMETGDSNWGRKHQVRELSSKLPRQQDAGNLLEIILENIDHDLLNQEWSLSVAEGSKIQLTFETFDIEAHPYCLYDYVEVANGSETKKLCGSTVPDPITSSANTMTVKFKSDYSVNKKGFSAVWKKV